MREPSEHIVEHAEYFNRDTQDPRVVRVDDSVAVDLGILGADKFLLGLLLGSDIVSEQEATKPEEGYG